jgi:hypothetical protein
MQDINELFFGQFEHLIEHFLHIIFLQILQKSEQFIHIKCLFEEILHIIRQLIEHILELQIEQFLLNLFILHIEHLFSSFNLILCLLHSFLFLKSLGQRVIEHFLHCLLHALHNILLQYSHIVSDIFLEQISHL